jgi:alpha-1,3-mannosyltransferase
MARSLPMLNLKSKAPNHGRSSHCDVPFLINTKFNMNVLEKAWSLASDPKQLKWIAPLQLLADAALCGAVIVKVPCTRQLSYMSKSYRTIADLAQSDTNIDWNAYMQQIEIYLSGERDYAKIAGDTGPLVYPAAHVYIYRALYYLTDSGTNIFAAQCIFAGLYLATLWIVMQCYRAAGAPPYIFPILSLSKRMHSIFMLRLFNDCWAIFFLFAAIWCWQRKLWTIGTLIYSFGLGVKMILLLPLPAIGMVLWQGMGRDRAFYQAQSIGQIQVSLSSRDDINDCAGLIRCRH